MKKLFDQAVNRVDKFVNQNSAQNQNSLVGKVIMILVTESKALSIPDPPDPTVAKGPHLSSHALASHMTLPPQTATFLGCGRTQVVAVGAHHVRIESILGEGGLATVYRAVEIVAPGAALGAVGGRQSGSGVPQAAGGGGGAVYALKHMRLASPEAARDMADEARTLAKVCRA